MFLNLPFAKQNIFEKPILVSRGYFVSTVDLDEKVIREYIKNQEYEDRREEQNPFFLEVYDFESATQNILIIMVNLWVNV